MQVMNCLRVPLIFLVSVVLWGCAVPGEPGAGPLESSRGTAGSMRPAGANGQTPKPPESVKELGKKATVAKPDAAALTAEPDCTKPRSRADRQTCERARTRARSPAQVGGCASPRTTDEWLACSRAGKIKEPKPDLSGCANPRTTDEWLACSNAGKIKEPRKDLSHCHQPRNTDEWLTCSRAGRLKK